MGNYARVRSTYSSALPAFSSPADHNRYSGRDMMDWMREKTQEREKSTQTASSWYLAISRQWSGVGRNVVDWTNCSTIWRGVFRLTTVAARLNSGRVLSVLKVDDNSF